MEVVIGAGILGFILSAMLAFFVNAMLLNETSRNLTVAVSHAEYVLEDIRSAVFDTVPDQINQGIWTWNTEEVSSRRLTPLKNERIATTKVGTELLTVTVTVSWEDSRGRQNSFILMTHMAGG